MIGAILMLSSALAVQPAASPVITEARIAADGESIVFARPAGVFRITFGGLSETQIAGADGVATAFPRVPQSQPADLLVPIRGATVLHVTPVGERQSVTLSDGTQTWIELIGTDGKRITVMPRHLGRIVAAPSWSADGKRFAVLAIPADSPNGTPEIFAGSLPLPQPTGVNMGARPPAVRQVTGNPR